MVSPRAHSLLKLSADFITDRVMPVEATVLAHTYVQQSATPPHINSTQGSLLIPVSRIYPGTPPLPTKTDHSKGGEKGLSIVSPLAVISFRW